jgi:hypothetical protein
MQASLTNFDPTWIKPGFSAKWCPDAATYKVAKASMFRKDMSLKDKENKVVIGLLLSVSTPSKATNTAYGLSLYSIAGNNKRSKINATYAFILVFADLCDLPNCFAVILQKKSQFQFLFNSKSNCEYITIGDPICFVEPAPTDDRLGSSMTIVKDPARAVSLQAQDNWPTQDLTQSEVNSQVAFHVKNKIIALSSVVLRTATHNVGCGKFMCDRQNIKCAGCFGTSPTRHPIVLQCDVQIMNVTDFNRSQDQTANFPGFRSWRFSNLFFVSLDSMCSLTTDEYEAFQAPMRRDINEMVRLINNRNGWTIVGWHRRGVLGANEEGEELLSNDTTGHISYLMPTNPGDIDNTFRKFVPPAPRQPDQPNPQPPAPAVPPNPPQPANQHPQHQEQPQDNQQGQHPNDEGELHRQLENQNQNNDQAAEQQGHLDPNANEQQHNHLGANDQANNGNEPLNLLGPSSEYN